MAADGDAGPQLLHARSRAGFPVDHCQQTVRHAIPQPPTQGMTRGKRRRMRRARLKVPQIGRHPRLGAPDVLDPNRIRAAP